MSEEDFIKKIGANIAKRREEKGLSQAELASEIDEEVTDIIMIENGSKDAAILTISHIADALDIPVRNLFD